MSSIEFFEQIAKEQIENIDKIQIEYKSSSIIIVNTFLNELYYELYNMNGYDKASIEKAVTTENIKPYFDEKLSFFKVALLGMLTSNNYNLKVLQDELKIKYSWIINQLLTEIKKEYKNN